MPLCFALVLKAHSTLVHLVGLNTKLAAKALGIICQSRGEETGEKNPKLRQEEVLTHSTQAFNLIFFFILLHYI